MIENQETSPSPGLGFFCFCSFFFVCVCGGAFLGNDLGFKKSYVNGLDLPLRVPFFNSV